MMNLVLNTTFYPVGQGLFYAARIIYENQQFNVVYDCGTSSKRDSMYESIATFKTLSRKKIDLLVISHFHADHVNGLDHLLSACEVDTVVLPYITPVERLFLTFSSGEGDEAYFELLSSPFEFLRRRGAKRVYVIDGHGPNEQYEGVDSKISPPKEGMKLIDDLKEDEELKEILEKEFNISNIPGIEINAKNDGRNLFINGMWLFKFFHARPASSKIMDYFSKCIKDILNIKDPVAVRETIGNKDDRKRLASCYEKVYPKLSGGAKLNATSLIMYHGPLGKVRCNCTDRFNLFLRYYFESDQSGTLLLGDIDLKDRLNDIRIHFSRLLSTSTISMAPHHGSDHNWNPDILDLVGYCCWVVSYGLTNTHKHPGLKVQYDLAPYLVECTEKQLFNLSCTIAFKS